MTAPWRPPSKLHQEQLGHEYVPYTAVDWLSRTFAVDHPQNDQAPHSNDSRLPPPGGHYLPGEPPLSYTSILSAPSGGLPYISASDRPRRYTEGGMYSGQPVDPTRNALGLVNPLGYENRYPAHVQNPYFSSASDQQSDGSSMTRDLSTSSSNSASTRYHPPHRQSYPVDNSQTLYNNRLRHYSASETEPGYRSSHRGGYSTTPAPASLAPSSLSPYERFEAQPDGGYQYSPQSPPDSYVMSPTITDFDHRSFEGGISEESHTSPRLRQYSRSSYLEFDDSTHDSSTVKGLGSSTADESPPMSPDDLDSTANTRSKSSSRKKQWQCSDCDVKPFARKADMQRHQDQVHHRTELELHDCWVPRCSRKGSGPRGGFGRKDHLLEHMRNYHSLDIPKRPVGGRRTVHNTFDQENFDRASQERRRAR